MLLLIVMSYLCEECENPSGENEHYGVYADQDTNRRGGATRATSRGTHYEWDGWDEIVEQVSE